jgi:osmotically inducible protein OsmC
MTTFGTAKWQGGLKDGKGAISTKSGALTDTPMDLPAASKASPAPTPRN